MFNKKEVNRRIHWLEKISTETGWKIMMRSEASAFIRFKRDQETMIDVWYTSMKCALYELDKKGRRLPHFINIENEEEMEEIFITNRHQ